ncbi:hypothetical protein P3T76_007807 [Phytophthora citrophthora]|uniref:Uncharacterized protein n=1 Tax=Phytophthora citrophthora TaxID=4793 RepID=A0AAD9GNG7_9STRA|nr:hypothetical protein P3T76_007802 [Phytophthora citrophthora]KAK1941101.1 hypothetical protein P3T76_007807 [Phytophthora citrophthora]
MTAANTKLQAKAKIIACSYCGEAPCEWVQYRNEIMVSRLRMVARGYKRLTARRVKAALSQLYYYKRNGRLSKPSLIYLPHCVENGIRHLNGTVSRVCTSPSPDASAQTASSAERTPSELDVRASR